MRKALLATAVVGALTIGTPLATWAEDSKGYSEMALSYEMLTNESLNSSASTPVLAVKYRSIGKRWNNFGSEVVLGIPMGEDTVGTAKVRNAYWAVFFASVIPLNEQVDFNAKLGYGTVSTFAKVGSESTTSSDGGLAWGLGASYKLNNKVAFSLDYNKLNSNVGGIGLGANYRF